MADDGTDITSKPGVWQETVETKARMAAETKEERILLMFE
jgi:hypothetical protein